MGLQWARGPCWGQEQGWVAFAAVSRDAIRLLKALATDLTGEAQGGHCLCVLSPVPIQGGLLTTGEPADFALQGLLSSVDATVDDQIAAGAEGPCAELTDVVPGVCKAQRTPRFSFWAHTPPATQGSTISTA